MMYVTLILISTAGLLNASITEIPTLDNWTTLCIKRRQFSQMKGLQQFLLEKEKVHFETFCWNNKIATEAEITMITHAFEKTLAKRLNGTEQWVGANSIESNNADLYNAYYLGLKVPIGAQLYCWGDRHGDARSLPLGLCELHKRGIVNQNWEMPQEKIPVLLGDYVNNGAYSVEAALAAMILYINNELCIAIRGNHESTERPISIDWAIREMKTKYAKQWDDQATQKATHFFQLLEKLPVAAFVAFPGNNDEMKHILITHAAPDLGVNPEMVLMELKNRSFGEFIYRAINPITYNRHSNLNPTAQGIINNPEFQKENPNLQTYLNVTRQSEPRDLSFCRDQMLNGDSQIPFLYYHAITTLGWGLPLIEAIMKDWKIFCIIRSHQHAHALDCIKNPSFLGIMRDLWEGNGVSFAWKENRANQEREIVQNDVVTVQVAPDSIYGLSQEQITGKAQTEESYPGFSHDTIAVVTITPEGKLVISQISVESLTRKND